MMTDTKAPAKPAAAGTPVKKSTKKPNRRNYDLGNGVYRFSRTKMFHKKAVYKFLDKKTKKTVTNKKPVTVVKKINGDKNGETRVVHLHKRRAFYPTSEPVTVHHAKKCFKDHARFTRPSLVPGTVCILLAGPHKGKRVILLKTLPSGLLLVNGPFLINACPLRRMSQRYVIATSTKVDVSGVKLPEHIDDDYFKRKRDKRAKKEEGDIFSKKKEKYVPSEQRKMDQKAVDKALIAAIRQREDKKLFYCYLSAMFGLRSSQYPHRMKF